MIDTHCHIDLYDSPLDVARDAEARKIWTLAVTYLPSHYQLAGKHLSGFKYVLPGLGLHPLSARDHGPERQLFKELVKETCFIGEVGLDFSKAALATAREQEKSFELVSESIASSNKIVTVHSRNAEDRVLSILNCAKAGPVIFHWFSGSRILLKRVIEAGHMISINPAMTKTSKWAELIGSVPLTSILTETDGPFVRMGSTPALPRHVDDVAHWLSTQFGVSVEKIHNQIEANFHRLCPAHLLEAG